MMDRYDVLIYYHNNYMKEKPYRWKQVDLYLIKIAGN